MRAQYQCIGIRIAGQKRTPCVCGKLGLIVVAEIPFRVRALQRTMNQISGHHPGSAV